ncbi:uncharacterized protein L969DRAFT_16645 [Mixia osmundae IAM 14324]|uniref:Uncharacterized protein n=1 Tax=Mixia osmundae (strain CBS 9802 / IAM 14324 / JCM 22182 / KY 12970) TaxID=764103 RepID=G7E9M1_MIXOS|nr:uncharacterized protein L969DRAFT_16645 [Mixia osmundae IAM 14324]KEI39970.1 hypothetical protein L969DRAFT_16645 [Mixia osmundae IAM 14324]GAA99340.1 hypothetical protein E5Q_06035 [Mixia osmundae IAM 14324]
MGVLRSALRSYESSFARRPLLTIAVTNAVLAGVGDAVAQELPVLLGSAAVLGQMPPYDLERTARFIFYGASIGPLLGKWNHFLEVTFPLRPLVDTQSYPMNNIKRGGVLHAKDLEDAKAHLDDVLGPRAIKEELPISRRNLVKRLLADQLIAAPIGLCLFLSGMSIMEGLEGHEIVARFAALYWPIIKANWTVWPILQYINFRYLPLSLRVPYGSVCGIAWTCFLSLTSSK